jgi:hypothetical protein
MNHDFNLDSTKEKKETLASVPNCFDCNCKVLTGTDVLHRGAVAQTKIPKEKARICVDSEKYGRWTFCTSSRLLVYDQQAIEVGGRRTMAV